MGPRFKSFLFRYGIAVAAVVIGSALRQLFMPILGTELPFILLLPAVAAAAFYAGFRSGMTAMVIGAVVSNYLFVQPRHTFGFAGPSEFFQFILLVATGTFIAWVAAERRRIKAELTRTETRAETVEREAAEALKESEERSRLAQISAGVGVWEWTPSTGEVAWSEGVLRLVGLEGDAGRATIEDWVEMILPEDRETAIANVRAAIDRGDREFHDEFRIRRVSDGEIRWIAVGGRIFRDGARPTRLIGVDYDVTKRKQDELRIETLNAELNKVNSELVKRLNELQAVIDISPVGIAVAQDASCNVIFANPALSKMVGVEPGENISLNQHQLAYIHRKNGRQLAAHEMPMQRAVAMRQSVLNEEIEIERADGSRITIYGYASPVFDSEGNIISCVAAQVDITERKMLELKRERELDTELHLRLQAEEANRLKDEFLATVSHELRTPLNSIIGWVAVLRDETLPAEITARAVDAIERGARAQSQLIEDLLDVSRIITGKLQLAVALVDLGPVVNNATESLRPAAAAKGIELDVSFGRAVSPVTGDADRLQQVVWNLLSNAIKFTPAGGSVSVRVDGRGDATAVTVSDTGRGVSPDFLPFVFDRFRQADGSITRNFSGLGLGLAIVRHLVELHGGTVAVESGGEGQGSTFIVTLPSAALAVRPEEQTSPEPSVIAGDFPKFDGARVLIIDDEEDTREILRLTLERCDAGVEEAGSAADALEIVKAWRPQVIISDIGMPGRDGYAFIREVREWERRSMLSATPSIALTAYAREQDRRAALESGFQVHLSKPVEPLKVAEVVCELLKSSRNARHTL